MKHISFWLSRDRLGYRLSAHRLEWYALHKLFGIEAKSLNVPDEKVPRSWRMPAGSDSVVELRLPVASSERRVKNPKVTVALIPVRDHISFRGSIRFTVRINRKFIGWACAETFSGLYLSRDETTYFDFEE